MPESTVEKQLANSNSRYIQIRAILLKYNLPQLWICSVRLTQSIPGRGLLEMQWIHFGLARKLVKLKGTGPCSSSTSERLYQESHIPY